LCQIDEYFENFIDKEEEEEAFKALRIKMEKEKHIKVYFIDNEYVSLNATMPVSMYNKNKHFITFLQISIRIIIITIMIIIITYIITYILACIINAF
jgi:hypothetical protein